MSERSEANMCAANALASSVLPAQSRQLACQYTHDKGDDNLHFVNAEGQMAF